MRRRFCVLVIAAFALSSCADAQDRTRDTASVKTTTTTKAKPPRRAIAQATPTLPKKSEAPADSAVDESVDEARKNPEPDKMLVELDEDAAEKLFGTPYARHENATNKTWYYREGACALSLYFYLDMSSRVFRTLAYEVASDDQSAESRDQCISRLQSQKHSAASGERAARE
jgi:hypothetical protein